MAYYVTMNLRTIWLLLLMATSLEAAGPYYVGNATCATNGNDAFTGLDGTQPWTLSKGLATVGPGETLYFLPGTWIGPSSSRIEPRKASSGTPVAKTYFRSLTKWGAIVDGSVAEGIQPITGSSNMVFIDFKIQNTTSDGLSGNGPGMEAIGLWVTNCHNQGINFSSSTASNGVVDSCLIEYNGVDGNQQKHGLYIGGSSNIVRNNVIRYNRGGAGIHFYTGYANDWINGNEIYNNLIYGHSSFYDVVIYADYGNGPTWPVRPGTNYVHNNTILCGMKVRFGELCASNNIVLASPQNSSHPIYYAQGTEPSPSTTKKTDYNLSTIALDSPGANDVVGTPTYVNSGIGLYWPAAGSAGLGVAASGVTGPVDFYGLSRASVADIGAFQYASTNAADTRTLSPSPAVGADYWGSVTTNTISNVSSATAPNTATVTWDTLVGASSGLEWGTTTAYGSSSTNSSSVTSHSLNATSLSAGTLYHYKVHSTDTISGTHIESADGTFTTSGEGYVIRATL